jgi:hypothetical protein
MSVLVSIFSFLNFCFKGDIQKISSFLFKKPLFAVCKQWSYYIELPVLLFLTVRRPATLNYCLFNCSQTGDEGGPDAKLHPTGHPLHP